MSNTTPSNNARNVPDTGPNVAVTFAYDKVSHCLSAVISLSNTALSLDLESLKALIKSQGFDQVAAEDTVLMELLSHVRASKEGVFILSGSAEHSKIQLTINPKSQKLVAQVVPSGTIITYTSESIHTLVQENGFNKFKLNEMAIENLLKFKTKNNYGEYVIGAMPQETVTIYASIQFEYDKTNHKLIAHIIKSDIEKNYTFASVQNELKILNYDNYGVTSKIISDLIGKISQKKFGRYVIGEKPQYTQVDFVFDEHNGELCAELSPCDDDPRISQLWINETLKEKNFDNLFFEPGCLDKLFRQIKKHERGRFHIAKRKDAGVKIDYDDDVMHAYITFTPSYGGNEINKDIIQAALKSAGIVESCCNQKTIAKIIAEKTAEKVLFASGVDKKEGKETQFEALVKEVEHIPLKENKTGQIDFRDALNFTQVEAGVQLMRRHPAIPGKNGKNVKGQAIPVLQIDDIPFNQNLTGVRISEDDPNILISEIKGHPVILTDGVKVDEVIVVNNVDMSTGNIDYDGSIMVKGEVMPGMKVRVTGDIVVRGVVRKALLTAKNNITIHCGVIGADPSKDAGDSSPAILKAGGNITAQYVSQAKLIAMQDIVVREYISHCHCEAKHRIIVGQAGGKGRIFGGDCHAHAGIIANHIGADSGLKTLVSAGIPPKLYKQFQHLEHSLEHRIEQRNKLAQMLKDALEATEKDSQNMSLLDQIKTIQKLLNETKIEIDKMDAAVKNLQKNFKECRYADIAITKGTYANILVSINGAEFLVRQESKGGKFIKQGKDIRWTV